MGGPMKSKDQLLRELDILMDHAWSASLHFGSDTKLHKDVVSLRELVRKERKKIKNKED